MAHIMSVVKGRTEKVVTIGSLPNGDCGMFATGLAMEAAGEKPVNLFGHRVDFYEDDEGQHIAVVRLYTD